MKAFDRELLVKTLEETAEWDVLIIGGGATGLGLAVDAATRGYKTLLVEQSDFAKGTSSRSTKLVHGGVRYLAQGDIGLVREALKERGLLLQNAPHITHNESFIIPCYSRVNGWVYTIGLKMYDWLAGQRSLGRSHMISKKEVLKRLPGLKAAGLKFGVLYHDGTFDDARLAVNLAQTAIEQGAIALNYMKVVSIDKDQSGRVSGARLHDLDAGRDCNVKARVLINATGVFADDVIKLDNEAATSIIRPSQGIHLVLDKSFLQSDDAIMIPRTDDGRVLFAIPWHEKVLIGTTDTPIDSHALEPRALENEIQFIFKTAAKYLTQVPQRKDVLSVFAGLRPLAASADGSEKTKEISRSHKIIVSDSGLVSVIGGKWTTYRKMAEDTLGEIIKRHMLPFRNCETEHLKIHGSLDSGSEDQGMYGADLEKMQVLASEYPAWLNPVNGEADLSELQVIWSVRNELARTVEDVLARRTRILFTDAARAYALAPAVADIMAREMGKGADWAAQQTAAFKELAKGYMLPQTPVRPIRESNADALSQK